jgi:hypothetical protein
VWYYSHVTRRTIGRVQRAICQRIDQIHERQMRPDSKRVTATVYGGRSFQLRQNVVDLYQLSKKVKPSPRRHFSRMISGLVRLGVLTPIPASDALEPYGASEIALARLQWASHSCRVRFVIPGPFWRKAKDHNWRFPRVRKPWQKKPVLPSVTSPAMKQAAQQERDREIVRSYTGTAIPVATTHYISLVDLLTGGR